MKTKLAVAFGVLALIGVGAVKVTVRREPERPVSRPRHKIDPVPAAQEAARFEESRGVAAREERRSVEERPAQAGAPGGTADRLLRSGDPDDRDAAAVALMGEPAPAAMAELRKAFQEEKDPQQRLRLAHVLIIQQKRHGQKIEIEAEVLAYLEQVVSDSSQGTRHGSAIAALARWETGDSFRVLGRVMSNPSIPSDFAKAAEWLSESRNPKAGATILQAFQATDDADSKLIAANALLKLAGESPETGLASVLRGQVRPALELLLAKAEDDWERQSISRMIQAIQ